MIIGVTHDHDGRVVQRLSVSTKVSIGLPPNGDRNHPTKLDHFAFLRKKKTANRAEWEADPELTRHYGEQCRELHIVLIDDDMENVFPSSYAWWTATERKCWGGGVSATRRTSEKPAGQPWDHCGNGCAELASGLCKPSGDLRFVLADFPRLGSVRRIHTSSYRSIRQIHSALQEIQTFTGGRLAGITAKLTVRPEEATYFDRKEKRKKTSSIWALSLEVEGDDVHRPSGGSFPAAAEQDAVPVVAGVPGYPWLALYTVSGVLPVWENAWRHTRYSLAPAMISTCKIVLPSERFRLEEINMPEVLASALAGQAVDAEVHPEAPAGTLRLDLNALPDGLPFLVGDDGILWNGYWPERVLYMGADSRVWRLPRHWLSGGVSPIIEASRYEVMHRSGWLETWCPPTWWDRWDINIEDVPAADEEQGAACVEVSVAPGEIPKVLWKGPSGKAWRIPHDWRRRRIRLPDCEGLLRNDLPLDIADDFGGRIVAVNYHPGSLCCLSDGYRVRDGKGGKWPVRAADCVVVGFGDEAERYA